MKRSEVRVRLVLCGLTLLVIALGVGIGASERNERTASAAVAVQTPSPCPPCPCASPSPTVAPTPVPSPSPTATPSGNTIAVDASTRHQTISGWEATAQAGQSDFTDYPLYRDDLVSQAVADGINRIRLQIRTRAESPTPNASVSTNDNANPFVINPAGFQWNDNNGVNVQADLINRMRTRLAQQGETLYVNACRVDFQSADQLHSKTAEEDAELWEATFLHLWNSFGWVPDAVEVILEADKTSNIDWTPARLNVSILATQRRLAAHGWHPKFILPSTTACRKVLSDGTSILNAVDWYNRIIAADSRVTSYISELSYHRYGGANIQCTTDTDVATMSDIAAANGHSISMLEKIGADYKILHDEVKNGVVAWQQYALAYDPAITGDNGSTYYLVNHSTHQVTIASRMKFLRQYFKFIRRGAVRIDAQSGNVNFDPVAFINPNGKYVVVVKAAAGGSFNLTQLPAGTYGIKYTTATRYNIDLADQVVGAGQVLMTAIPAAGVITVYGK